MKNTHKEIISRILESAEIKYLMLNQAEVIGRIADKVIGALKKGHKAVLFGNGGSASDSQHLAAEITGCFTRRSRRALPAIALTANTSNLTAIGNDYGFEHIFSRQVEALVNKGDIVLAFSTSGNSINVIKGVEAARRKGAYTVGFTGNKKNKLKTSVDLCFSAPAEGSARIQECHITAGHIICEMVDNAF